MIYFFFITNYLYVVPLEDQDAFPLIMDPVDTVIDNDLAFGKFISKFPLFFGQVFEMK